VEVLEAIAAKLDRHGKLGLGLGQYVLQSLFNLIPVSFVEELKILFTLNILLSCTSLRLFIFWIIDLYFRI